MTLENFSSGFDTLLNSYITSGKFGETRPDVRLDEYEKSVFLTKAQEEIALSLYNGKNVFQDRFEHTEEVRRYLSSLITEAEILPASNDIYGVFDDTFDYTFHEKLKRFIGISNISTFFKLPDNLWFITYEAISTEGHDCDSMSVMDVFPVRQDEWHKIKRNPFRGPNRRRAMRLDLPLNYVEIVCKYAVSKYYIRYLKKLKPIILVDLGDDQNIEGIVIQTPCELHEGLHQRILELAVRLALQSKGLVKENNNRDSNV